MTKTRIVVIALLTMLAAAARAQAVPTATSPGTFIAVGATYSMFQTEYGNKALGGAGVHVDLNGTRALGLEGEARWLRQGQEADTHQSTYLIGPRYQKVLGGGRWRPYAKVLVGLGRFSFPYGYATGQYFVVAPGAGLEFRISSALSVRVLDVEYQRWPQFTYGPITPYGVSAGLTWRVFGGGKWAQESRHPWYKND